MEKIFDLFVMPVMVSIVNRLIGRWLDDDELAAI